MRWSPALEKRGSDVYGRRPEPGWLIAVNREPFRVIEVRDRDAVDWSDETREMWLAAGMPEPWHYAPYVVVVEPARGGKRRHLGIEPHRHWGWFRPIPEHYAVCVKCGELAPCREVTAEREAVEQMRRFEALAAILPGCCWSCGEVVTSRQASITYVGENVLMPTAPVDVVFHTRSKCLSGAREYEEAWVLADPRRPRTRLTMRCQGTLVVHGDRDVECFGADGSDCPSVHARHRGYTACYVQTHGCPRGCDQAGHRGAREPTPPPLPARWPSEHLSMGEPQ